MIPNGLFTQIGIAVLSVGIIVSYIRPTFTNIAVKQDQIAVYQVERAKVSEVNTQLSSFMSTISNISPTDNRKLLTYMPDTVDVIGVPRDIEFITEEVGVLLKQISYEGLEDIRYGDEEDPATSLRPLPYLFSVSFEGSYEQIKGVLQLLEQNEYPLEVRELDINKVEGGFLAASLTLATYGHLLLEEEETE